MPLLIIPAILLVALAAWIILLPYLVWRQYRLGRARRRAVPWVIAVNSWVLLASALVFLITMTVTSLWWTGALGYALLGLMGGAGLGLAGTWLGRFESTSGQLYFIPIRWPLLVVYGLVASRLVLAAAELWRDVAGSEALALIPHVDRASLFAVAGVVLGYYLALAWGVKTRLARRCRKPLL